MSQQIIKLKVIKRVSQPENLEKDGNPKEVLKQNEEKTSSNDLSQPIIQPIIKLKVIKKFSQPENLEKDEQNQKEILKQEGNIEQTFLDVSKISQVKPLEVYFISPDYGTNFNFKPTGKKTSKYIIDYSRKLHGKDRYSYIYVNPDITITSTEFFNLICNICSMIFITAPNKILKEDLSKGCPWCKNECKDEKKYSLRMIQFISEKRHGEKYNCLDNPDRVYNSNEEIYIYCIKMRKRFLMRINNHISGGKKEYKAKGCPECELEEKNNSVPKEKIIWYHNLEDVKIEGERVHGKGRYNYDLNNIENITNVGSKLIIECLICFNMFSLSIRTHIYAIAGCPGCSKYKILTLPLFLERSAEKYPDGKFILDKVQFKNSRETIIIICKICGYINDRWTVSTFLMGKCRCINCETGKVKWNDKLYDKCQERAKEGLCSYEHVDFSKEITYKEKIPITCLICKEFSSDINMYVFHQTINDHFNAHHGCRRCAGNYPWRYRLEEACKEREKEGKYDYSLIDFTNIGNRDTLLPIICLKCKNDNSSNYIFYQSILIHFNLGCGCQRCGGSIPWTYATILEKREKLPESFTSKYIYDRIIPEEIKNSNSQLSIGCKDCSNYFNRKAGEHFTSLRGCPYCNKSYGSQVVFTFLKMNNIPFEDEYPCPGINGYEYRFDYFFKYKGKKIIIEYDGENHQKKNNKFHSEEGSFEDARLRDIHKQYVALQKDYYIIRIDHTIPLKEIEIYLQEALQCKNKTYYSTPSLYDWMEEGIKTYILPEGYIWND